MNEPAIDSAERAVLLIADSLGPLLDRPYALFGHCIGAALAYEASRVLRDRGHPEPAHLFASGAPAPHYGVPIRDVERMSDDELIEYMQGSYGAPLDFLKDPHMRPYFLPTLRADARMTRNYRYVQGPKMDCPITAVAGDQDPFILQEQLEGWRLHSNAAVTTRLCSGGHFYFLTRAQELMSAIAEALAPVLNDAAPSG